MYILAHVCHYRQESRLENDSVAPRFDKILVLSESYEKKKNTLCGVNTEKYILEDQNGK